MKQVIYFNSGQIPLNHAAWVWNTEYGFRTRPLTMTNNTCEYTSMALRLYGSRSLTD